MSWKFILFVKKRSRLILIRETLQWAQGIIHANLASCPWLGRMKGMQNEIPLLHSLSLKLEFFVGKEILKIETKFIKSCFQLCLCLAILSGRQTQHYTNYIYLYINIYRAQTHTRDQTTYVKTLSTCILSDVCISVTCFIWSCRCSVNVTNLLPL